MSSTPSSMPPSTPSSTPQPGARRSAARGAARRPVLRPSVQRDAADLADALDALLAHSGLGADDRVQALGGALVREALRSYWGHGRTPSQAHEALRRADAELADVIEALAPLLLGRAQAREDGAQAIATVESLLRGR
jgi:hypothetical protein